MNHWTVTDFGSWGPHALRSVAASFSKFCIDSCNYMSVVTIHVYICEDMLWHPQRHFWWCSCSRRALANLSQQIQYILAMGFEVFWVELSAYNADQARFRVLTVNARQPLQLTAQRWCHADSWITKQNLQTSEGFYLWKFSTVEIGRWEHSNSVPRVMGRERWRRSPCRIAELSAGSVNNSNRYKIFHKFAGAVKWVAWNFAVANLLQIGPA